METIVLFDPGIRSLNKGDEIIMRSAKEELMKRNLLKDRYVIHCATHSPVVTFYQNTHLNSRIRVYDDAKYKWICGSNLMWKNLFKPRPVFNVNLFNCQPYKGSIFMGIGVGKADMKLNLYTKMLYKKILNKDYIHSARDQKAVDFLNELGYEAIDTGCPSMWKFTPEFCKEIPHTKASNVIFTLTDYGRDKEYDQRMINILKEHYDHVYFWIQGVFDKEYFDTFENISDIKVISPSLEEYSKILSEGDIDYVGTRLHAGIYAMQHKVRSIIIAIDNRTRYLKESYYIHSIERNDIDCLGDLIESQFKTDVRLKQENIEKWFSQFEEYKP